MFSGKNDDLTSRWNIYIDFCGTRGAKGTYIIFDEGTWGVKGTQYYT